MKKLLEYTVPANTGWAAELKKGQVIRISGTTTVDFVAFSLQNLRERFDQARTKVYNMKLFISTGDKLMSKSNQHLMTIAEDTYRDGTHDLQKGMCSRKKMEMTYRGSTYGGSRWEKYEDIPPRGCFENLSEAMKPYGVTPEDLPNPLNIFQTMKIDGNTGKMEYTYVKPRPGTYVDLRAEMDLLIAVSACPEGGKAKGKTLHITIYEE